MAIIGIIIVVLAALFLFRKPSAPAVLPESQTAVAVHGRCGPTAQWRLHEDGQLYITGSGAMFNYEPETTEQRERIAPWHIYRRNVRSLVVGRDITALGTWSFAYLPNLVSVTLACRISALPMGCFYDCENLDEIEVPRGVKRIGALCFMDCVSLDTVHLPKGLLQIQDSAFYGSGVAHISLPESLEEIESYAFGYCQFLTDFYIPDNVSYIHADAFAHSNLIVPPRGYGIPR